MNVFEGMAVEKFVVVVDNRGYCEIIEDGVNGFFVLVGDSVVFVDWIGKLYCFFGL